MAGRYYDLEFACARAAGHLRRLPDHSLERRLQTYLDGLQSRVRTFLGEADDRLAEEIKANWGKYLNDPRLSTHVLWDFIRQRRLHPKPEACLWMVVFDGMRWDTWQRVVKPRLLELFEMKTPEKAYLSLLPSWTPIARTGLLAGRPPAEWKGPDGRPTRDQGLLAARFFEIPAGEREAKLQFYSGMESDRTYRQLDRDHRYPWNVLIFNISDDGLHQERGDLVALNAKIKTQLDDVMQTLSGLVGPEDTMVVSSDHGFVELENDSNGITIQEDDRLARQVAGERRPCSLPLHRRDGPPRGTGRRAPRDCATRRSPWPSAGAGSGAPIAGTAHPIVTRMAGSLWPRWSCPAFHCAASWRSESNWKSSSLRFGR